MNAIPEQAGPTPFVIDWKAIYAEVNAWRGECMHHFSAVEHAVTKTLFALDEAKPADAKVRLRHLIGQRFEDLAEAIGSQGTFANIGHGASKTLTHYRDRHEAFRTQLCHGHLSISVEPDGNWLVVLRTLTIRARQAHYAVDVIDQTTAESRLKELRHDGRKLSAVLGQVRKTALGFQSTE